MSGRHLVENRWDMLTVEHDVTTLAKTEGVVRHTLVPHLLVTVGTALR